MKRSRYPQAPFSTEPTWTVLTKNKMLGTSRYGGTFSSLEAAQQYASTQADRSRSFASFEVFTGSPSYPGVSTGFIREGKS